jgi:hypothetical protein
MTSKTVQILNLLTERNSKFISTFIKYTNENDDIFHQKSLIFAILSSNIKYKWDEGFLNKLYDIYKTDIFNFLTELKFNDYIWIQENVDAVLYLIDSSFGK